MGTRATNICYNTSVLRGNSSCPCLAEQMGRGMHTVHTESLGIPDTTYIACMKK